MNIIVDAGPLAALLNPHDQHHPKILQALPTLPQGWKTCEAVITEALHLLQRTPHGAQKLGEMLQQSLITLDYSAQPDLTALFQSMRSYRNFPMSFADACLVRMMEKEKNAVLFTLDKHFEVYRYKGRRLIPRVKI